MRLLFSLRFFLYLAYGVTLTATLLFVRFPEEKFRSFCEKRIEFFFNDTVCTIRNVSYKFPFSLSFENSELSQNAGDKKTRFFIDQLVFSPKGLTFWKTFTITGEFYSGTLKADLALDKKKKIFQLQNIVITDLATALLVEDQGVTEREVRGNLSVTGTYQAPLAQPLQGTGNGKLDISSGSFELKGPILALASIDFDTIDFTVSYNGKKDKVLKVSRGVLAGEVVKADFDGQMKLTTSFLENRLQLTGHLEAKPEYLRNHPVEQKMVRQNIRRFKTRALPFKLNGTVNSPAFRLSR